MAQGMCPDIHMGALDAQLWLSASIYDVSKWGVNQHTENDLAEWVKQRRSII